MDWIRAPGRLLGGLLLATLLIPAFALLPAALIDRGPDGLARISIFPLALSIFDPFVWTCTCNSLTVAGLVAVGSLILGVGLAVISDRWRFWGRSPLWALLMVPMAAGPLFLAPGINLLVGERGWDWLAARSILGFSGENLVRWAALVWVGLASGVPLVALATSTALRHVEPAWLDAARAVGVSRWRIWREIVWPILRPETAKASATVFTLVLVEPAGPLILGLRRTLAFQILLATRPDQPTRLATLGLLAIGLTVVGRTLIRRWGGPGFARSEKTVTAPDKNPSFRRSTLCRLLLCSWGLFAAGPIAFLLCRAFQAEQAETTISAEGWMADPEMRVWVFNSLSTAAIAVTLDVVILLIYSRGEPGTSHRSVSTAARIFEAIPPLALGVGALATPWLVALAADAIGGPIRQPLDWLARELSPGRSPGFVLILALAAGKLPMLARFADLSRSQIRPARLEAARLMGTTDRLAKWAGPVAWLGVGSLRTSLLAVALAATNLVPALVLTPYSGRRTLAPAVLDLLTLRGGIDSRLAGAMAAILAVRLLAFALASRSRSGSLGEWFRGV